MKVFKFGGASWLRMPRCNECCQSFENQGFWEINAYRFGNGKTNKCIKVVVENYFAKEDYKAETAKIKQKPYWHSEGTFKEDHKIYEEIEEFFYDIESFLRRNKSPNYSFVYDQVVSCGEMISSKNIIRVSGTGKTSQYMDLDARDYIKLMQVTEKVM